MESKETKPLKLASESTSQSLVPIQPASIPKAPVPQPKKKQEILDEDAYVQSLQKIIERDYFPELPKLRKQLAWMEAEHSNDFKRMKELQREISKEERKNSGRETPLVFSPTPEEMHGKEETENGVNTDMSLDKFTSNYTSEDNESFENLITKKNEMNRNKYEWAYNKEKEAQLLLTGPESNNLKLGGVQSWKYAPTNSLLWTPDGVPLSETEEKIFSKGPSKEILKENTRLDEDIFKKPDSSLIQEKSHHKLQKLRNGKIDLDDLRTPTLFLDSPQIGGYSFVMTPSPVPGSNGDEPLLTWGTIDGTPVILESPRSTMIGSSRIFPSYSASSSGHSFHLPEVSEREQLAHKLVEKSREKSRAKVSQQSKTNTPLRSPSPLHPSSVDLQLRASYSTPSRKRSLPSSASNTPISKTPRTSPFPSPKAKS